MSRKVSIIIPCRNEEKNIESTIQRVLEQDYDGEIEILVIDGKSDDCTHEKIKKLQIGNDNIYLITNEKRITPVAFNLGIQRASGFYVLIVGARQQISSNYVRESVEALESDPELACVGGKVINIYETTGAENISLAMSSGFCVGIGNFRVGNSDKYVDTVGTPVYRKSIFDEIGEFDEALIRNQDDEFNFRVIQKGYKIKLLHKIEVKYVVRPDIQKLSRQMFQYGYWKVYVNRKHKSVTTGRQLIPAAFVLFLAVLPLSFFMGIFGLLPFSLLLVYIFFGLIAYRKITPLYRRLVVQWITFNIHIFYGAGYLKGMIDFLLLWKKQPAHKQTIITR